MYSYSSTSNVLVLIKVLGPMSDHNITFYIKKSTIMNVIIKNDLVFNPIFNRMLVPCQNHLLAFQIFFSYYTVEPSFMFTVIIIH